MKKLFNGFRWLIVIILVTPTFILIVGGGVAVSVSENITNPENPKKWLSNGNIYENAVQVGVEEIINKAKQAEGDSMSVEEMTKDLADEQEIKRIASNIFPPEWVRSQVEVVIDSAYSFLRDDSKTLEFNIDLSQVNEDVKVELSSLFAEKAKNLPACLENTSITLENINLLEADCIPEGIQISQIEERIKNEVDKIPYFQKDSISSEDLDLSVNEERSENMKNIFKILENAYLIALFIILIFSSLIFLAAPRLKSKLKTIGYLWAAGGITLVVISFIAKVNFSNFVINLIIKNLPQENTNLIGLIKPPVEIAFSDITNYILILGSGVILIGIIIAISSRFAKK